MCLVARIGYYDSSTSVKSISQDIGRDKTQCLYLDWYLDRNKSGMAFRVFDMHAKYHFDNYYYSWVIEKMKITGQSTRPPDKYG